MKQNTDDAFVCNPNQFTEYKAEQCLVSEASTLQFSARYYPRLLKVNETLFELSQVIKNDDRELQRLEYVSADANAEWKKITVFWD